MVQLLKYINDHYENNLLFLGVGFLKFLLSLHPLIKSNNNNLCYCGNENFNDVGTKYMRTKLISTIENIFKDDIDATAYISMFIEEKEDYDNNESYINNYFVCPKFDFKEMKKSILNNLRECKPYRITYCHYFHYFSNSNLHRYTLQNNNPYSIPDCCVTVDSEYTVSLILIIIVIFIFLQLLLTYGFI